ncbi:unnamed protein product [Allacma fusca]|uniref:EF-hand domain-containing protein n=1 Tax=Allacma fusca TaxID=39272 RepID=A0A8J2KYM0_9HEXA|nr:unnamed protein product [Allacma fusca]
MSEDSESITEDERPVFRPFTRESLVAIQARISEEYAKKKELEKKRAEGEIRYDEDDDDEGPHPNPNLEQGMPLPIRMAAAFDPELASVPLEDIDPFYANMATFVIVSKKKDIFRFSATDAVWLLSPFNPVRRVAIGILTHSLFTLCIITTILTNCLVMIMPPSPVTESTEVIFTAIYTFESTVKVMARGFILEKFTYLRDAWNWLDFVVITLAYVTMGINLGNLAALRTFRVLRALKTVAIVPGLKTIVGAVIESVKNLRDVIILTMFSLSVFALMGLQIYMGVLTQKCVKRLPEEYYEDTPEGVVVVNITHEEYRIWMNNNTHWFTKDLEADYPLCGNSTGAGNCDVMTESFNFTCLQGWGKNPNYGYTSFDSFGWALLSAFRLMTQDFWESLYQHVLRAAGPWHMLFFILIIFLGSFYLVNLILAIVAMSYDELQKKAEEEDMAAAAEEEAMREEAAARVAAQEAAENKRKARDEGGDHDSVGKSPSFSCRSYEMWVGGERAGDDQVKEKMSIKSDCGDSIGEAESHSKLNGRVRKASLSLPGSPFNIRRGSRGSHQYKYGRRYGDKKPLVLSTYMDAQEHLPYADDSTAATPMSEENGAIIVPIYNGTALGSRHSSYNSHASRLSYTSHGDLLGRPFGLGMGPPVTKESQLRQRSKTLSSYVTDPDKASHNYDPETMGSYDDIRKHNLNLKQPSERENYYADQSHHSAGVDMKDVMVLNDIIEQAAGRQSKASDRGEEEEEGNRFKQKIIEGCFRCIDVFCIWDCGFPWSFIKKVVAFIVFDPFAELLITLAIAVNTLFMALDHYGLDQNPPMEKALKLGNTVFSTIFAVEALMKLVAMSPKFYFQVGWNIFDFIIVTLSLLEMLFEDANLPGISALRSFRLLRVFKLAKSWPTLNLLISIMGKTMGALGNLVFVLIIIIFIFAVMGMQLFAKNYFDKVKLFPNQELPRWNFTDFWHSFMIIFRVLCGEWIESMWDCMLVGDASCVPFFLATVIIGNLVVLNLFLALLLSSFGASNLSAPTADAETNKLAEAFNRIGRFIRWIKSLIRRLVGCFVGMCTRAKNQISDQNQVPEGNGAANDGSYRTIIRDKSTFDNNMADTVDMTIQAGELKHKLAQKARMVINANKMVNSLKHSMEDNRAEKEKELMLMRNKEKDEETLSMKSYGSHSHYPKDYGHQSVEKFGGDVPPNKEETSDNDEEEKRDLSKEDREDLEGEDDGDLIDDGDGEPEAPMPPKNPEEEEEYPADCFPPHFYVKFPALAVDDTPLAIGWANLRLKTFRLIENKYFETAVIIMILLSSLALALEDVHLPKNPVLTDILYYMDRIFTVIFFLEMLIKWLALGFVAYFSNAWCWLDFVIVMVSLINFIASLCGAGSVQAFKTMRTLRALRPLRAMSRMQGMRVVVNALVQAIPSIFNVLLVCLIFWLIFAIMGVQLFNGKFQKCIDKEDGLRPDYRIIKNKQECLANNLTWDNPDMNFDHVGKAYLCLFQVATFKGWIQIMNDATDSRQLDEQPHREVNFVMYIYFVIFIIFGSFFTLNLFIGVIIDNFNEQKKKAGGSLEMFMTDDQKKYYNAMKKMGSKKPLKAIPRPKWKPQAVVFEIVSNTKFDMIIMLFIGFNMVTMTMDHFQQAKVWDDALDILNGIFIAIFSTECALKVFALRYHYFKEPWNLFDFVVVILSIVGLLLSDLIEKYFVSPTLLRVVRVAKVGRVLRLVKGAKGIRTLLFALAMSLPALFNICLLLFLVMFIFAIFGMSFFMNVKIPMGGLDEVYNFQTFGQSMILLFQMSTSAGWDGVLAGIINEQACNKPNTDLGDPGNCGSPAVGIAFLLTYLVISFLIVINMYIAVILENYSQATEEVQEGLTDDDYDMYYEIWAQFDPDGTQYIRYDQLSDFLDVLEPPLQIHKPNKYKIISMDVPICKGDMMYCVDILDALTRDFFARKGNPIEEAVELNEVQVALDRPGYEPVSSTLWRQREEYCARLIQMAWRKHKQVRAQSQQDSRTDDTDDKFTTSVVIDETEEWWKPPSHQE